MKKIQCNGKCFECEGFLSGEIESIESCALITMNRRTFSMQTEFNKFKSEIIDEIGELKSLVLDLVSKKGKKSVPIQTTDEEIIINENK